MTRNCLRLAVLAVLADTRTKECSANQSSYAADHVYSSGAGKVMEAELSQPAAAPNPVAGNWINDRTDDHGIDAVRAELGSLCHSTGNDGRCGCTEHSLENQGGEAALAAVGHEVKAADECTGAAEHDAKANQPINRRAERKVHQVFHDDVAGILGTGEAGFHHRKACLHKEYERRAEQRPRRVYGRGMICQYRHNVRGIHIVLYLQCVL